MPDEPGTAAATDHGRELAASEFHAELTVLVDKDHEPLSKAELKTKMERAAAERNGH